MADARDAYLTLLRDNCDGRKVARDWRGRIDTTQLNGKIIKEISLFRTAAAASRPPQKRSTSRGFYESTQLRSADAERYRTMSVWIFRQGMAGYLSCRTCNDQRLANSSTAISKARKRKR